jgi:hypothetical protein
MVRFFFSGFGGRLAMWFPSFVVMAEQDGIAVVMHRADGLACFVVMVEVNGIREESGREQGAIDSFLPDLFRRWA